MTRRRRLLLEVLGRALGVSGAVFVLPGVFSTDVGHFRAQGSCVWYPTGKVLGMCEQRQWLIDGGAAAQLNLPYRHLLWEFPPLPIVTLPFAARFWGPLWVAKLVFGMLMAAVEFGGLVYLRRAWPEHRAAITRWWTITVAPVALIAWFRFDFLAVLCAVVALVALEQRRRATTALVAGWLAKLWPAVFLAGLVVQRRWRDVVRASVALVVATALWWAWSPSGFHRFLEFRSGKGLEIESLLASVRLLGHHGEVVSSSGAWVMDIDGFVWFNGLMVVSLLVFALACVWRAWRPGADVVALCGALTVGSMVFSRIISAQYVVWLVPFVALLAARGNRRLGWFALGAGWFTFAYLLVFDEYVVTGNRLAGSLVLVRNIFLVAVLVELFRAIRPTNEAETNTSSTSLPGASLG